MKNIRILRLSFAEKTGTPIAAFRGEVAAYFPNNPHFHNHASPASDHKAVLYRYPRVQYSHMGKEQQCGMTFAEEAIEGCSEEIQSLVSAFGKLGRLEAEQQLFGVTAITRQYRLYNFCMSDKAYKKYRLVSGRSHDKGQEHLRQQVEKSILRLGEEFGVELSGPSITNFVVESFAHPTFKGKKMLVHTAKFCTNASLPTGLGLGRHVAFGYGRLRELKDGRELPG